MDPFNLADAQVRWAEMEILTGVELMAAVKDKNQARIREVADTYADLRDQRRAYLTGCLKTWQPATAAVISEVPVDDPEVYLANAPLALVLIAADWSEAREH
jgi:hypothetical protein